MKALSLFSGAGGDTLGMELAGVSVVGFVELDKVYSETHLENFPNSIQIGNDITKIPDKDFLEYKDQIDILFAGFPCQGFSKAGKKDPNDKRNNLFYEFVRVAKLVKPKWIIGENVKGILSMKFDNGDYVKDVIVNEFEKLGYSMAPPNVIKCKKFGIPQNRERCFFLGYLGEKNQFDFNLLQTQELLPIEPILEETLENAIEIKNTFEIPLFKEINDNILIKGKPKLNLSKCLLENKLSFGKRASPVHGEIVDISKPVNTIICSYGRMPRFFVPLKNANGFYLRDFTVKELQQIQGFPKDYIFKGDNIKKINQIGNAVPPPVVKEIIEIIKSLNQT